MRKNKRYQLTEGQLKAIIKVIPENYPAGVTGYNIDRLSGADRDSYDYISDVEYNHDSGDIIFYVNSEQGQTFTKNKWSGDDDFIDLLQKYLTDKYPLEDGWEIRHVAIDKSNVIFDVDLDGRNIRIIRVPIDDESIINILPEIDANN